MPKRAWFKLGYQLVSWMKYLIPKAGGDSRLNINRNSQKQVHRLGHPLDVLAQTCYNDP
jgi:hypothetical protein